MEPDQSQNRRMGRPPLADPFVPLNTKVPREVRPMLEDYAMKYGVPLVDVLCRAIESYTSRERKSGVRWPRIVVRDGRK